MSRPKRPSSPDKIPAILDGKYFIILKKEPGGSVVAQCVACSEDGKNNKTCKGYIRPTSNFTSHLKNSHPSVYEEYVKYAGDQKSKKLKGSSHDLMTQKSLSFPIARSSSDRVDSLIMDYVIECMRPLNTVDQPAFKNLLKGISPQVSIISRKTLTSRIGSMEIQTKEALRLKFKQISSICLTADAWKVNSKSYFGATAHWLNDDLTRGSAAIALRRFKGSHNYSRISDLLTSIMDEYEISTKAISCVTDNASNFVKAFKEFGASIENDSSTDDGFIQPLIIELEYEPSDDIDARVLLPNHLRCSCHTISLIAKDCQKTTTSRISVKALSKCSKLWNSFSRSSPLSDQMEEICNGKRFLRPTEVRWNSLFDAIRRVIELKQHLPRHCDIVGIEGFTDGEYEFLDDYVLAMEPVATALDKLQGEKNCHYGLLGPTIVRTVELLDKIVALSTSRRPALCIATDLKKGFLSRFRQILEFQDCAKDVILADVCHPYFKLKWVPIQYRSTVKEMLIKEASYYDFDTAHTDRSTNEVCELDSFFQFQNDDCEIPGLCDRDQTQLQCLQFLDDPSRELKVLDNYKVIRSLFLKHNTSLPSSAPVERFFSCAGSIMTAKRNRLSDQLFEQLAFLKINRNFQ